MRRARILLAAVLALGLGSAGVTDGAAAASEAYAQLLAQIDSGLVTSAVVNRRGHDVKVTLRDSSTARVIFPPHQRRQLVDRLRSHGARVSYTRRRRASTHHILRYIGGAIVIVIIAAGGGVFLHTRRDSPPAGRPGA